MAIEKEKFFEIICNVSESKDLNEDNLLQKIKYELCKKDYAEYDKFKRNFSKEHQFSIKISDKIEDWTLLHLAAACNNLLTVELLLEKKVSVNARVKDGSKDGGLTALHIASSYGHENIIELLLSDNRVNPSLKSKNMTPREMVGDVPNRDTIIKMLEAAEKSYRTKPKENAKDLNIKIEGEGHYHLLQDSHGTPAKTVKKRSNAAAAPANVISPYLKQHDATRNDKQTSVTGESSDSTADEQCLRVSVKNMVEKIESSKKTNATYSDKRILTDESDSEDSGLELGLETASNTSSRSEINHDGANHVEENVDNQTLENALRSQKEENQSLKQQIQDLESKNTTLEGGLGKAQKELTELRNCVTEHETKLEVLEKLNEENESLEQKIQDLESEKATLKDKLDKTESQYSKAEVLLEKAQKELEESKSCIARHETKLKQFNKENESLTQKIKSLENENTPLEGELGKTKTNEVSLEKVGKRQFSPKVAYASLAAMLAVGAALRTCLERE